MEVHLFCRSELKGFRKIDADKWEFAKEGFLRGKKHLLRNIQRRKAPQSQHVGSSSGAASEIGKAALEGEIVKLRKERSLMMQEVVELQQQQRGTIQQMETVGEKLQAAEQRQKQIVSFLAKVFQNPAFLSHLRQNKEQRLITSPRAMKKFVKHQQHELCELEESSMEEGQMVKHTPDLHGFTMSPIAPTLDALAVTVPEFPVQEQGQSLGLDSEHVPPQTENIASDGLIMAHEARRTLEQVPSQGADDPLSKGKNVVNLPPEVMPEYVVSFPDDLTKEKSIPEFSSLGIESMVKEQELWAMGFEVGPGPGMSSSSNELLWGNISNYEIPEVGVSSGLSDNWELGSLQAAEGSGVEKWPGDESPFGEVDSSKNPDPWGD